MPAAPGDHAPTKATAAPPGCLRLIADDLTGALDTAVQFVAPTAPIDVFWQPTLAFGSVAIDAGTREQDAATAARRVAAQVSVFQPRPDACHFAKLDSLLRGHASAEIRAWHEAMEFSHCLVAPAFPRLGRVTRGGRQYWRDNDAWRLADCDLAAELRACGFTVSLCRPGDAAPPGLSFWDAESDADLLAIAAAGNAVCGPVLWCGCGGLATALGPGQAAKAARGALARPLLGLIGTDHPVTRAQLAECQAPVISLPEDGVRGAARIAEKLATEGCVLVQCALPDGIGRAAAAERIGREFAALLRGLAPPATLFVSGGETLRGVCDALAANHLQLIGELLPGIPRSRLRGGRFDGVAVVSKSGAFGAPDTLRRLLDPGFTAVEGTPT